MAINHYKSNRRNYYRLLHVQPDAPLEIIKASYRTLMQKLRHHPDLGGDDCSAALLNEAYAILTNPSSRAKYDIQAGFEQHNRHSKRSETLTSDVYSHDDSPVANSKYEHIVASMEKQCIFCKLPLPSNPKPLSELNCPHCHSPLKGTATPEFDTLCNRVLQRTDYRTPLKFFTQWPQSSPYAGTIHDMSPVGLGFSSTQKLSANQLLKVSCVGLQAVAEVTYCKPGAYRNRFDTGLKFLTLQISQPQGRFVSETV